MYDKSLVEKFDKIINLQHVPDFTKELVNQIKSYYLTNHNLTQNQKKRFNEIQTVFLNPERIKKMNEWKSKYPELKKKFDICRLYYKNIYDNLRNMQFDLKIYRDQERLKIVNRSGDSDFIPSEREYNLIVSNRFAKLFYENYCREPIFQKEEAVVLKKNVETCPLIKNKFDIKLSGGMMGVVIETKSAIPLAVKGGVCYSILLFGQEKPIDIQEKYIKRLKK